MEDDEASPVSKGMEKIPESTGRIFGHVDGYFDIPRVSHFSDR
jgi:hypothetical protein